jgi:hypothetical protein
MKQFTGGTLCFLQFYTTLAGLEGSVFVVVSSSERVGYLILLFRANVEKPLFPGLRSVA